MVRDHYDLFNISPIFPCLCAIIACVTPSISDSRVVHELTAKVAIVVVGEQTSRNTDCKTSLCLAAHNNSIVCFLMRINRVGENMTPLPLELTIFRALKQHRPSVKITRHNTKWLNDIIATLALR